MLSNLKIAQVIGKAVWDQRGDIRDVISIGKLVRKNDGPEEVEQILGPDDQVRRSERALNRFYETIFNPFIKRYNRAMH